MHIARERFGQKYKCRKRACWTCSSTEESWTSIKPANFHTTLFTPMAHGLSTLFKKSTRPAGDTKSILVETHAFVKSSNTPADELRAAHAARALTFVLSSTSCCTSPMMSKYTEKFRLISLKPWLITSLTNKIPLSCQSARNRDIGLFRCLQPGLWIS